MTTQELRQRFYSPDPYLTLHAGDALTILKTLPDESVDCVITSPPYYRLRAYQAGPQEIGQEKTVAEYISNLVAVFHEARRVLLDDGTCFIVVGDSYAGSGRGVPAKNLLLVPQRLAIALQDDHWIIRQEIVWAKKNPMVESVKNRFTSSHESILFLVKDRSYKFDAEAVAEDATSSLRPRAIGPKNPKGTLRNDTGAIYRPQDPLRKGTHLSHAGPSRFDKNYYFDQAAVQEDGVYPAGIVATGTGSNKWNANGDPSVNAQNHHGPSYVTNGKRNKRDVFWCHTNKDPGAKKAGAHFACFPEALVEPLLLAGCPPGGTVLDMFAGSGTVGTVAQRHGRNSVLIELSAEYCGIVERRLNYTRVDASKIRDGELCLHK